MPVVAVPMPSNIFSTTTKPAQRKKDFIDVTFEPVIEGPPPEVCNPEAALPAPEEE